MQIFFVWQSRQKLLFCLEMSIFLLIFAGWKGSGKSAGIYKKINGKSKFILQLINLYVYLISINNECLWNRLIIMM